jgi:tyrosinase
MQRHLTRRSFLGGAMLASLAAGIAPSALAQTVLVTRQDWKAFRKGKHFGSFIDAVRKMKANTTAGDPRARAFWAQIHHAWCTHHVPYFLTWHRGYLALFERELRRVSGDPALNLPYWNYYEDPSIPAEFTDPSPWNPLYSDRINTNVSGALTTDPFAATVTQYQGSTSSFEYMLENKPHDPVHDLIGSTMATMDSPLDPIFWLHHANIDRLLNAWVAAGGGRAMPASTSAYWDGSTVSGSSIDWQGLFKYSDTTALPARFTVPVRSTIDTRTDLGYFYENETLPPATGPAAALGSARGLKGLEIALGRFASTGRRRTAKNRLALGGVLDVALGEQSVAARIVLDKVALTTLQAVLGSYRTLPFLIGGGLPYTAVKVVLSDVTMTEGGARGGYFYDINLDLPATQGGRGEESYSFGNLGPFRIAGLQHHMGSPMGVSLEFDITELLLRHNKPDLSNHRFLLDRINGRNSPLGDVIHIGEIRLELA